MNNGRRKGDGADPGEELRPLRGHRAPRCREGHHAVGVISRKREGDGHNNERTN